MPPLKTITLHTFFCDRLFGGVEAHYFVSDRFKVTGDIRVGTENIHGSDLVQTQCGIEGVMKLGQSNSYARAGYRGSYMNTDANCGSEGLGGENTIMLGVTMPFGGNSMRETFSNTTPMMTNEFLPLIAVKTATYD